MTDAKEKELDISDDRVVKKYKTAGEIVNSKCICVK
jgi:hypothetical protein